MIKHPGLAMCSRHHRILVQDETMAPGTWRCPACTSKNPDAERIIRAADQAGDFVTGDDGFVVYWPASLNGALNEYSLRLIADELERRNAPWAAMVNAVCGEAA